MNRTDAHSLRTIRRLNRRVHDPISAWLGAAAANLVRLARPVAPPPTGTPERQDLYGFSAGDSETAGR